MLMAKIELRYVQAFKDRHGRMRHYLRAPGRDRVALPGLPGSLEFMRAYAEALGEALAPKSSRLPEGTLTALVAAFYESSDFKLLKSTTRAVYRQMLERLREEHGTRLVRDMRERDIRKLMDHRAETPHAANNLLKRLRKLLDFAVERNWISVNPAAKIRRLRVESDGHAPWSDEDLARFAERWPAGTRERLALALLLYTGQRRSDVVGMGRQHVRDGRIQVRQVKTGTRVSIPLHPALAAELAHVPADQLSYLMTAQGAAFTAAGFGNWFSGACRSAGLQRRTAHGLRKTAGRCLAEAGCTAHQIMSILGHKTLAEAERYTRSAQQDRLADDAMAAWSRTGSGTGAVKPAAQTVKPEEQSQCG